MFPHLLFVDFHIASVSSFFFSIHIGVFAIAGYVSYRYGIPKIVAERVDKLFDPFGMSENLSRVLWSISSGGIWGSGIGYGEPFRIPVVQSDFNFAAICEELGLIGAVTVVLAYAVLVHRCFAIATAEDNLYRKTLVVGIGVLIGVQAFIIISGNLNAIPLTGITLPFVSYGGSSMIVNFFAAGILLKISGRNR